MPEKRTSDGQRGKAPLIPKPDRKGGKVPLIPKQPKQPKTGEGGGKKK